MLEKNDRICFSHDGSKVLFATATGDIRLFDVDRGEEVFSAYDPGDTGFKKFFTNDDRYIYSPNGVRDASTGIKIYTELKNLSVYDIWMSSDNRYLYYRCVEGYPRMVAKAIMLPTLEEAIAAAPLYVKEYEYTREDRLQFALD